MKKSDCLFLDTSALIAILNSRDQYHHTIRNYLQNRLQPPRGFTSNLILTEFLTFFARYGGLESALEFQTRFIRDAHFRVVWIGKNLHRLAGEVLKKYSDQKISFTDAVSFVIMKKRKLTTALAFDDDFRKAGFETVP